MSVESDSLDYPHEWLKRAYSNLLRARQPKTDDMFWEDFCFDLQQSAEKSIKAVLLAYQIEFPFVHALAELLTILETHHITFPDIVRRAAVLTDFAVATRYPGPFEAVTEEEYKESLVIAEGVYSWAKTLIDEQHNQQKL